MITTQKPMNLDQLKTGAGIKVPATFSMDEDLYKRAKKFRKDRNLKSISSIINFLLREFMDEVEAEELNKLKNKKD